MTPTQALKSWFGFCAGLRMDPLTGLRGSGSRATEATHKLTAFVSEMMDE